MTEKFQCIFNGVMGEMFRDEDDNLIFQGSDGSEHYLYNMYLTNISYGEIDYESTEMSTVVLTKEYKS